MAITSATISDTNAHVGDTITLTINEDAPNGQVQIYYWVIDFSNSDLALTFNELNNNGRVFYRGAPSATTTIANEHININTLTPMFLVIATSQYIGTVFNTPLNNLNDQITRNDVGSTINVNFQRSVDSNTVYVKMKNLHDHWSLHKEIQANTDLNDYTEPGMYHCGLSSTDLETIQNSPAGGNGFSLYVERTNVWDNGTKQTLTIYGANPITWMRTLYYNGDGTFLTSGWQVVYYDTGWKDITLPSGFSHYASDQKAQYRRYKNTVYVRGAIKNTNAFTPSESSPTLIGTIGDANCRPIMDIRTIQQGSGMNRFLLYVNTDGTLKIARYGTTAYSQVAATAWLNVCCSFLVG